jgi:uncharacterized protein YndB with AHSA1/START domain
MTDAATLDAHGVLTEPTTLKIQRLLPGPIERVWSYLTESDLRRQWLASGDMRLEVGAPVELTWRNDELTDPTGRKPDGFGAEHAMQSRITELDPPRRLAIAWSNSGDVSFDLEPQGGEVLLTIIHRRLADRSTLVKVATGWHSHLDVLAARAGGKTPAPFWDRFVQLREEYEARIPA